MASNNDDQIRVITLSEKRLKSIIEESVSVALRRFTSGVWVSDDEWLSPTKAAKLVRTRRCNVDHSVKSGELKYRLVNGCKRLRAGDVKKWWSTFSGLNES